MEIRALLLYLASQHLVHSSCPDGSSPVRNGECRGFYDTISAKDDEFTDYAASKCNELKMELVSIHDSEDDSYWKGLQDKTPWILLGLVCNATTKSWQWRDGSAVDYLPQQSPTHMEGDCQSGCVWFMHAGIWNRWCDSVQSILNLYCISQLHQPIASADGCESFEDDSEDGVCYQIGSAAESWPEAQAICKSFGADLASIHNVKENSFVRRLAVSKGELKGLFLGATISGKGNEFGWIDGSKWDYDNFYPGFPMAGQGKCVAMDTQGVTGEWVNTDCNSRLSVACVRQQNYSTPACLAGPWKEGDIIYSPGFPIDASTPCDFMFAVDMGEKVQLEVLMLEANSCCDHLKLYDDSIAGNLIANLTGEISEQKFTSTSNFMRVSWQPNGGVNIRGVMMTYRAV